MAARPVSPRVPSAHLPRGQINREMGPIVVLGGTGHIGSYLIPRLVELGHEVVSVSRGQRAPYPAAGARACWDRVRKIELDRESDEERFAAEVVALRPRAIVDMICFTLTSCRCLVDALLSASPPLPLQSLIHIGSIWAYGPSIAVPTLEAGPHAEPLAEYGAQKRAIASYLLTELTAPWSTCVLHPGHIVGRGWAPLNPQGNFDPSVFAALRRGGPLLLPNLGSESVHHVHADDIASAVIAALDRPERVARESFSVVSKQARKITTTITTTTCARPARTPRDTFRGPALRRRSRCEAMPPPSAPPRGHPIHLPRPPSTTRQSARIGSFRHSGRGMPSSRMSTWRTRRAAPPRSSSASSASCPRGHRSTPSPIPSGGSLKSREGSRV